jgi:transaldolase
MLQSQLDQLRKMTVVVADTGDIEAIKSYQPTDATTNPSLILQSAQKPEYRHIVERSLRETSDPETLLDTLFVNFGVELLKIVPGRVSTEVDAALSFDTKKTIDRAKKLISLYEHRGIPRGRVLIKIAATWEGIRAAEVLEMEGIHCNMTLIFSLVQAAACAQANVTLISPFVGRILDWHLQRFPNITFSIDPGVAAASQIYTYYKKFGYKTAVMGASFRNKEEILALAGCDLLTIAPKFLDALGQSTEPVTQQLSLEKASAANIEKMSFAEPYFRFLLNEDAMASEKLSEGIRIFVSDSQKLKTYAMKELNRS